MEWLSIGSSILSVVTLTILGWFGKSYFPNYLKEKSKNKATKEDIEEITSLVESVKKLNSIEIEQIKSDISNEDKLLEKRREVYEEIVSSLKIFISGHATTEELKEDFHAACSKAWLWAPDSVLQALNEFLDAQVLLAKRTGEIDQVMVKDLYGNVVVAMRKDVGFSTTTEEKFRFVTFN
jgi:hypothetical protein